MKEFEVKVVQTDRVGFAVFRRVCRVKASNRGHALGSVKRGNPSWWQLEYGGGVRVFEMVNRVA